MSKYYKFFILFFTFFISFIFITPNAYAQTYINPGLTWEHADLRVYYVGSGSQNYYNIYQNVEPHSREEFEASIGNNLRHFIFNLYNPVFEIDQPMVIFCIVGLSFNNFISNGRIPTCYIENGNGQNFKMQILDYKLDNHDNEHAYIYNLGDGGFMLFVPLDYFYIRPNGGQITGAEFINIQIGSGNSSVGIVRQNGTLAEVSIQYMGAIDFNDINYTNLLESILSSTTTINTKLDTLINILNNQQSSSTAASQDQQTTTEHDQIDQIQNNTLTDIGTVSSDIINNNNFNLHDSSMLSGATYITAIANNIFTSMGTFSWLLVFCGFLAIIDYILGRVGII